MKHNYKHFTHENCEYFPCHDIEGVFNCLFCYCPLYFVKCPGKYKLLSDGRKDCSNCQIPHKEGGWEIVQEWLKKNKNMSFR